MKLCSLNAVSFLFLKSVQSVSLLKVETGAEVSVCAGGGESAAALHDPYAGGQSGLCSVPLVGLQRQEIPGRTGTPVRPAAGRTHTYVHYNTQYIL